MSATIAAMAAGAMQRRLVVATLVAALLVAAILAVGLQDPGAPPPAPAFAGSASCAECHAAEHEAWRGSQHALAMQKATAATVLGRFDDAQFTAGGSTSRFFQRDGRFYVNTDGPDGRPADFEVKYTFGVYPLQQYLVPFADGRLQALGIAWDSRPESKGGQRWFHLYPDQTPKPGDPLHWTGIDQNWNYQCAWCHSTNLRKNYDSATDGFATSWSEISVGCEACHGPASNHLIWARREQGWRASEADRGLVVALDERRGIVWRNTGGSSTATRTVPRTSSREIETCARCHARRGQYVDDVTAGGSWLDAFRPALIEPGLYYPDGQQREEVYTWGSFLQSRMHAVGVTCADCHEPHGGKLRAAGNGVCTQCHASGVYDTTAHHRHPAGSKGAECAACHMPVTTYMVVDPRHDHSLRIPRPDRSVALGTPNACNACHSDRSAQWATGAIAAWYPQARPGFQSFAEAFAAAERGDPAAAGELQSLIRDTALPALVRASAAQRLARYDPMATSPTLTQVLGEPDPLLRAAAAEALAGADPGTRADHLTTLLGDPVRLVRVSAARALAGAPEGRLLAEERGRFAAALDEWLAAQRFSADRPEAHTSIGTLHAERGAPDEAVAAYQRALMLDPTFVQAAVNLADVHRARGDESAAEGALREALARTPQAAAAHHALGLALIRQRRMNEAMAELREAAQLDRAEPRFAYVYAVALHDTGDVAGSLAVLREAIARHPYDRSLLDALTAYERGTGS